MIDALNYHVRDSAFNTNVMQAEGQITFVNSNDHPTRPHELQTLADRVKFLREEAGLSQELLAKRAGVSQGTIGNIESGARKQPRQIVEIALALDIPPAWLIHGRVQDKVLMRSTTDHRIAREWSLRPQPNVAPADPGSRRVPLLDYVQAGLMTEAVRPGIAGEASEFLLTDMDVSSESFALRIKGNSMEPEFREGDVVIIDPREPALPGDFVVAKNGDHEATFKKYRPRGLRDGKEVFELVPLNEDYGTMRSDQQQIEIIGTMVEHRKYRRR